MEFYLPLAATQVFQPPSQGRAHSKRRDCWIVNARTKRCLLKIRCPAGSLCGAQGR